MYVWRLKRGLSNMLPNIASTLLLSVTHLLQTSICFMPSLPIFNIYDIVNLWSLSHHHQHLLNALPCPRFTHSPVCKFKQSLLDFFEVSYCYSDADYLTLYYLMLYYLMLCNLHCNISALPCMGVAVGTLITVCSGVDDVAVFWVNTHRHGIVV